MQMRFLSKLVKKPPLKKQFDHEMVGVDNVKSSGDGQREKSVKSNIVHSMWVDRCLCSHSDGEVGHTRPHYPATHGWEGWHVMEPEAGPQEGGWPVSFRKAGP